MVSRKLHDFEVTRVAAHGMMKCATVRAYLKDPARSRPTTRARIETALRALGYLDEPAQPEGQQ